MRSSWHVHIVTRPGASDHARIGAVESPRGDDDAVTDQPGWTPPARARTAGLGAAAAPAASPSSRRSRAVVRSACRAGRVAARSRVAARRRAGARSRAGASRQQWTPPPPPPKPGIIPLRPLGVGEILDGAISSIRAQPRLMLGLSAVVAVITQVLIVPLTWLLLRDSGDLAFGFDEPASPDEQLDVHRERALRRRHPGRRHAGRVAAADRHPHGGREPRRARPAGQRRRRPGRRRGRGCRRCSASPALVIADRDRGADALPSGRASCSPSSARPTPLVVVAFVVGVPVAVAFAVYLYVSFALAPPAVVLEKQPVVAVAAPLAPAGQGRLVAHVRHPGCWSTSSRTCWPTS